MFPEAIAALASLRYSLSLRLKYTLIGSTDETVVSSLPLGLSRSPICALAMPAIPVIGEVIRVKPRLSFAVFRLASAASSSAFADWKAPVASSRSFWLTAFFSASGLMRARLAEVVSKRATFWARIPLASSTAASKVRGSISNISWPCLTRSPSR